MDYVFVYGSLRKDIPPPIEYRDFWDELTSPMVHVSKAYVRGKLYVSVYGNASLSEGDEIVKGILYTIPKMHLSTLDDFEGRKWKRKRITVFLPHDKKQVAWAYFATDIEEELVQGILKQVKSGDYKRVERYYR